MGPPESPLLEKHSGKFEIRKEMKSSSLFITPEACLTITQALLVPTSPVCFTSSPSSPTTLCLASPRQWGLTTQQQDSFRRRLRRLGHWGCLGISRLERTATSASATVEPSSLLTKSSATAQPNMPPISLFDSSLKVRSLK